MIKHWNPSCEVIPQKCGLLRGMASTGDRIQYICVIFTLSDGLSRGVVHSSGWLLKKGFHCIRIHIYK